MDETRATARLPPAAARLSGFDNFRLILLDHAPLLGYAVRAAAQSSDSATPGGLSSSSSRNRRTADATCGARRSGT